jgi:hypothetical protein
MTHPIFKAATPEQIAIRPKPKSKDPRDILVEAWGAYTDAVTNAMRLTPNQARSLARCLENMVRDHRR